ncbi:telomere-binding alpha subunit central domain-containing protein [Metarhizium album ARSEF 1941]|uniref:Telomere-binding alpha subunit central domain-containing protein n=1 Tax=Metarhizium album (strain ARSEF 1941) TaxID=1081103 RepID=A0A0B2WKW8_METAS|nr:telomere-binding alpha subunit central domain-containing protein [Metarhizium album ARSEF 1941]KHN94593.1 telomere-binding alpha subunit central domain-containing protein [Metarhizium album ARSEF 1941]
MHANGNNTVGNKARQAARRICNNWKCQMRIYDQSVQDEPDESVLLNIFWPQNDMPDASCGDVIIVFSARVQRFEASYSLVTHKTSDLHVYESARIPRARADASKARRLSNRTKINRQPSKAENEFVSVLYDTINKERLPSDSEFNVMKRNSVNVKKKNKFSELKDLQDGMFVDAVVEIVKEPYDLGDKFTLWVSDYTEHPSFYHFKFSGAGSLEGGDDGLDGDSNMSPGTPQKSESKGPFGKMSMQITCFEPHASVIRDKHLSVGTWICLRNLQVKFGHSTANLEGYLREERGVQGIKVNISKLNHLNGSRLGPELKSALDRKEAYERRRKKDLEALQEAANAGLKRRAQLGTGPEPSVTPVKTAKQRRTESRLSKQVEYGRQNDLAGNALPPHDKPTEDVPEDLNRQIKCENGSKAVTSVADILAPAYHEATIQGDTIKIQLPFINSNYRTYVRVTDFMPCCLEDFARPKRRIAGSAALSDNEDSAPESASGSDDDTHTPSALTKVVTEWEWRFYLKLENATRNESARDSIWVVVNNQSAQMLLSLDASDLRNDEKNLSSLRLKLWSLWGNLEEQKAIMTHGPMRARHLENGDAPPGHSDDDEEAVLKNRAREQVCNCSFGCCIRQYGVTVAEDDETMADAGNGKRWLRMFALFGTRISG